jgi:hypothetical protein
MTCVRMWAAFAASAAGLLGCAANPPLMFGDTTTVGLRLGNDTATIGGSVSFGYKAHSIALVPVSILDGAGTVKRLLGNGVGVDGNGQETDAMSVFASFELLAPASTASAAAGNVRLGQVFATGLAAQSLGLGYACRGWSALPCGSTPSIAVAAAAEAKAAAERASQSARQAESAARSARSGVGPEPSAKSTKAPTGTPYQSPLVFLRTDVYGVDIGGSMAEQGLLFTLGYNNRNLAFIPTYATAGDGSVVPIFGGSKDSNGEFDNDVPTDAMSVLGQFKGNTETAKLGLDLGRYFATGVAARHIALSLRRQIAAVPTPPPPKPAASSTGGPN